MSMFANEVMHVVLEVSTQGILGGQVHVEGVQGTWADLTLNVNVSGLISSKAPGLTYVCQKMASNLTNQVRSILEVTKAITCGDLSKFVNMSMQGEMLDFKLMVNPW